MKNIDDTKANTSWVRTNRSFEIAPINLPVGPLLVYPYAYINLAMITASPTEAEGIGKYNPPINKNVRQLAIHST